MRQEQLSFPATGKGPEMGAAVWLGGYAYDLLTAPEWQKALLSIMSEAGLRDAQVFTSLGSDFVKEGDWLVATGCKARDCDAAMGVVALRRADNAVMLALRELGQGATIFGDQSLGVPLSINSLRAGN